MKVELLRSCVLVVLGACSLVDAQIGETGDACTIALLNLLWACSCQNGLVIAY